MSKDKISAYSPTADNNTDVGGIGIKGSDPVHNMDNGLREIMSHLADMNAGTSPISDAFTIGAPSDEISGLDKQVRFDVSDVTKGQKRVLKVPDNDGMLVVADDNGVLLVTNSEGNSVDVDAALLNGNNGSYYLDVENLTGTLLDANLPLEIPSNAATATNATNHIAQSDNPHGVTKVQVGLGNVDNTSDADKPISTSAQTALDDKANVTALTALLSKDSPQTLSDAQKKQVLKNLGLVNNRVVNNVLERTAYAATTDRHILEFDTDITTMTDTSTVRIFARIVFERHNSAMFYLMRDGVEIGSASPNGSKTVGIAPINYDNDTSSTMTQTVITYEDVPLTAGSHTYSVHVRGTSNGFYLNRTSNGNVSVEYEEGASEIVLEEFLT